MSQRKVTIVNIIRFLLQGEAAPPFVFELFFSLTPRHLTIRRNHENLDNFKTLFFSYGGLKKNNANFSIITHLEKSKNILLICFDSSENKMYLGVKGFNKLN